MASSLSERFADFDSDQIHGSGFVQLPPFSSNNAHVERISRILLRVDTQKMNMVFNDISTNEIDELRASVSESEVGPALKLSEHAGRRMSQIDTETERSIVLTKEDSSSWSLLKSAILKMAKKCSALFGIEYEAVGPTLIRSMQTCPRQLLHCDMDPSKISQTAPRLTILVFIHDPGALIVYDGGHGFISIGEAIEIDRNKAVDIVRHLKFKAGEMCIFRQDLPHRGAASQGLNDRLFFELIPSGRAHHVKRKNRLKVPGLQDGETFYVNII